MSPVSRSPAPLSRGRKMKMAAVIAARYGIRRRTGLSGSLMAVILAIDGAAQEGHSASGAGGPIVPPAERAYGEITRTHPLLGSGWTHTKECHGSLLSTRCRRF